MIWRLPSASFGLSARGPLLRRALEGSEVDPPLKFALRGSSHCRLALPVGEGRVETLATENRLRIGPPTPPGVQTHQFSALGAAVATRRAPEGQLLLSQLGLR